MVCRGIQRAEAGTALCSGLGSSPSAAAAGRRVSAQAGHNSRRQGGKSVSVLERNWPRLESLWCQSSLLDPLVQLFVPRQQSRRRSPA